MTIVDYVFSLFGTAFSAVFGWFFQFLVSAQALGLYISVFCMYCVVRFLIAPLIGDAVASERHDRRVQMSRDRKTKQSKQSKKGD